MNAQGPGTIPWLPPLTAAVVAGEPAVLVVVATVQGSAPRETGAAMVVTANACTGSVGGGHLEFEALRAAREGLDRGTMGTWTVRFPLAARLGQCCGGVATLAFSRIDRDARSWVDTAVACERTHAAFALLSCVGATPGTQLLVTADDARGTLGSADLDSAAVALARTRLAGAAQGPALVPFAARERATLLPKDPDASARDIRARLGALTGAFPAVLVTDSFGRPWRDGITDVAIGAAGIDVLADLRGMPDADGRELHATVVAVADELASAAELAAGKASGRPVVLVRGYRYARPSGEDPGARPLVMDRARDLFPSRTTAAGTSAAAGGRARRSPRLPPGSSPPRGAGRSRGG